MGSVTRKLCKHKKSRRLISKRSQLGRKGKKCQARVAAKTTVDACILPLLDARIPQNILKIPEAKATVDGCILSVNAQTPRFSGIRDLVEPQQDFLKIPADTKVTKIETIEGRRIVDVSFFIRQILNFPHHGLFSCTSNNVMVVNEIKKGLISTFNLTCVMCNVTYAVHTEDPKFESINVNGGAVAAGIAVGIGNTQLTEFFSNINIPPLGIRRYKNIEDEFFERMEETALQSMVEAGIQEAEYAKKNGQIGPDGVPEITVIADGAWCKRSYKTNYDAHSGVGCIIGYNTKKVLFVGVKNKYCVVCSRYGEEKAHICFKNYTGSSSGMESSIIVEGFKTSMELHGIRYKYLIADGDSTVHKKIIESRPYGCYTVEKIECKNHLLRNYSSKLRELSTTRFSSKGKLVPVVFRKSLKTNILRLRTGINSAIMHYTNEDMPEYLKVAKLKQDIANAPLHIFGDHKNCSDYFCNKQNDPSLSVEGSVMESMVECGFLDDIYSAGYRLKFHASSLLKNVNNNAAEQYNSIVSKFIGGKRIDFSKRGGFEMRCKAAAISRNSDGNFFPVLHKSITGKSPGVYAKKFSEIKNRKKKYLCKKKLNFTQSKCKEKEDYGPDADKGFPEIDPEDMNVLKAEFLVKLKKSESEILKIEELSRTQRDSALWYEERALRLTASSFARVSKMRKGTNRATFVKELLVPTFFGNTYTEYGIANESNAFRDIKQLLIQRGLANNIRECGLFICQAYPFLAASPDGVIDDKGLIEIKCPFKAKNLTPKEAITTKILTFAVVENDKIKLKRNDKFYYQVQGQLFITGREYCYFVIWTPKGMEFERIEADGSFWIDVLPKLKTFYFEHLLPSLIQRGV